MSSNRYWVIQKSSALRKVGSGEDIPKWSLRSVEMPRMSFRSVQVQLHLELGAQKVGVAGMCVIKSSGA
jgi:hypothetical protein